MSAKILIKNDNIPTLYRLLMNDSISGRVTNGNDKPAELPEYRRGYKNKNPYDQSYGSCGQRWIRTTEGVSQQIYSLPSLTA